FTDEPGVAWLISPEQKIAFNGAPWDSSLEGEIKKQLAKVKYPGLGLPDVDRSLTRAADFYVKKQYARARSEAEKVRAKLDGEEEGAEIREQAKFICRRVQVMVDKHINLARKAEADREYLDAVKEWEWVAKEFRG